MTNILILTQINQNLYCLPNEVMSLLNSTAK